jgi:hypothetical protein
VFLLLGHLKELHYQERRCQQLKELQLPREKLPK